MKTSHTFLIIIGIFSLLFLSYIVVPLARSNKTPLDWSIPIQTILSGTYECLPFLDPTIKKTECVFGLKADDGIHYMVNFGASASAMDEFKAKKHITAKGFIISKEALNTDQWVPYNMKWIFTITERL